MMICIARDSFQEGTFPLRSLDWNCCNKTKKQTYETQVRAIIFGTKKWAWEHGWKLQDKDM